MLFGYLHNYTRPCQPFSVAKDATESIDLCVTGLLCAFLWRMPLTCSRARQELPLLCLQGSCSGQGRRSGGKHEAPLLRRRRRVFVSAVLTVSTSALSDQYLVRQVWGGPAVRERRLAGAGSPASPRGSPPQTCSRRGSLLGLFSRWVFNPWGLRCRGVWAVGWRLSRIN